MYYFTLNYFFLIKLIHVNWIHTSFFFFLAQRFGLDKKSLNLKILSIELFNIVIKPDPVSQS